MYYNCVNYTDSRTTGSQVESSGLCSKLLGICYLIWRGLPITPQKFSGDLRKAWGFGVRFSRKLLSLSSSSVYRWLIMQLVLAGLALLFSMMPDQFFTFRAIQWLLTTVIVLSIVDFVITVLLNHPNRTSQPAVIQFKIYSGIFRSYFYDLFLYPILILTLFRLIRTQSYLIFHGEDNNFNNEDTWEFAVFSVVASLYIMIAYVMWFSTHSWAVSSLLFNHIGISGSRKMGMILLKGCLVQIVVQVAIQIMLLIMICVRYQAEMSGGNFYYMRQEDDKDGGMNGAEEEEEGISQFLKVMIAGGILIPMFSLPMYFVSTQKLVEEFPIGLFLNSPSEQRAIRNTSNVDTGAMKAEFSRFHKYNTSTIGVLANIMQPLFSPIQVVLCAVYTLLLLSFFVCFSYTHTVVDDDSGHTETVNAFKTGLYSDIYNMPYTVIKGTFVVALLATIMTNILPMMYGMVGAVLLPFNCIVGLIWILVKFIRTRSYLSIQSQTV